ncbi:hypothetical protein D9601_04690 [Sphingomonas sp. MA1305]|uniref:hypothetical protein n=1 Tax=Sphingomonas sp. MA1305 TaxID=2479204 RepID=UPI0018E00DAF|nr:hypothetical protein [Sphingomonas sp. MA1305]MBI0474656.1 hypothetical protein [Sphingomonas sp. MA1305]
MAGVSVFVVRVSVPVLLAIAVINVLGSLIMVATARTGMPGGLLFALSAALSSALVPFIAAAVLARFDGWFSLWAGSKAQ